MEMVFNKIAYAVYAFVFLFQISFAAVLVPTAQHHANSIELGGVTYTNATNITSVQARKVRFFTHIVDQHFGLNPNSYATYIPIDSEDKRLRSEFILENTTPIGGIGIIARRQEVEQVALHIYLFEVINNHSRPTADANKHERKTFKDHINTISSVVYNQQFLDGRAPQHIKNQRTQTLQIAIDSLNLPNIWTKLQTICTALPGADIAIPASVNHTAITYADLNANITALRGLIAAAATGGANQLSTRPNSAEKVQVITDIKIQIENLGRLLNKNSPQNFPAARVIAEQAFIYAMGRPNKTSIVFGNSFNINCPLPNPIPNPITTNIVRMVSQTPWYRPPVGVAVVGTMTTMAQRPNAVNIMVGFLRYSADDHDVPSQYHEGDLDYATMYPIS